MTRKLDRLNMPKAVANPPAVVAREFNARTWVKQGTWPGAFLWFFVIMESFAEESTGQILDPGLGISDYACIDGPNAAHDCFIGNRSFEDMRKVIETGYRDSGAEYFKKYADLCTRACENWLVFARSVFERKNEIESAPSGELAGILGEYFEHMRVNGAFMDTIIVLADVLGDVVGRKIDSLLRECGIDDPAAYRIFLELNSHPPLSNNLTKSNESIRSIALEVKRTPQWLRLFSDQSPQEIAVILENKCESLSSAIRGHIDRFGWMNTYSFSGREFSTEDIIGLIQDELDQFAYPTPNQPNASQTGGPSDTPLYRAIERIQITPGLNSLLAATRTLTNVNTAKDDAHQISWREIRPLMEIIGKRIGCTVGDLTLLTPEEIEHSLLAGSVDGATLRLRAEGWSILKTSNTLHLVQGRNDCQALNAQLQRTVSGDLGILKGRGIYPGRVKGQVRVVYSAADCIKVNDGDILVATNTNPDFIPAMRRAAAFVTDTGNLICHAVIAAREFRKPCVISTQIATQVFRDGDWVEVDGVDGSVIRVYASDFAGT